ncbi:hypothetical protein N1851_010769 [Merluccius polli]|uniref:Uncharacterized protein n=1 Tax=Merluccius polli TaxID=89951 RepID=A0AA47MY39_MERPO|nr:hypothetical protein N1851_010769 [Merluccius polli]
MLQEEMGGGSCLVALVEGGDYKLFQALRELPPRPSCRASSEPIQPAPATSYPRDTSASRRSSPRPPVSGTEGEDLSIMCYGLLVMDGTTTAYERDMYARGIVDMFPYLRDPYSKNGYEHFYDGESGSGYLAWRLKTIQRKSASSESRGSSGQLTGGGPTAGRDASFSPEMTLSEEQCREAMSFMKHSSDEATIKQKMKMTFEYHCNMILDEEKSSDV